MFAIIGGIVVWLLLMCGLISIINFIISEEGSQDDID
jgi:hypothetical protein